MNGKLNLQITRMIDTSNFGVNITKRIRLALVFDIIVDYVECGGPVKITVFKASCLTYW